MVALSLFRVREGGGPIYKSEVDINGRISWGYAEIKQWLNHPEKWVLISNEGIKQTDETNYSNDISGICHLTVLMELMYTQPPTNETGYSLVIKHGWMGPYQWRVLWKKIIEPNGWFSNWSNQRLITRG